MEQAPHQSEYARSEDADPLAEPEVEVPLKAESETERDQDRQAGLRFAEGGLLRIQRERENTEPDTPADAAVSADEALLRTTRQRIEDGEPSQAAAHEAYDEISQVIKPTASSERMDETPAQTSDKPTAEQAITQQEDRIRQVAAEAVIDQPKEEVHELTERLRQTGPPAKETETPRQSPDRSEVRRLAAGRPAEQLSLPELLTIGEHIAVDNGTLRQAYEARHLPEHSLRRIADRYMEGYDAREALARELLEYEMHFEQDPYLKSDDPEQNVASTGTGGFGSSSQADDSTPASTDANMTSEERARAAYEQRQLQLAKQSRRQLNVLGGTGIAIVVLILLILLLQR